MENKAEPSLNTSTHAENVFRYQQQLWKNTKEAHSTRVVYYGTLCPGQFKEQYMDPLKYKHFVSKLNRKSD